MNRFTFEAHKLSDTDRLGALLAEVLPPGTTVALCGTLGSGKTRLVKAIASACGVPEEEVVSPTFVLCQEYHGQREIYHWDAYRLNGVDDFLQLGPEECFDSSALVLIEWADRVIEALPRERIEIHVEVTGDTTRSFQMVARGEVYESTIEAIQKRLVP
ncbi:MAG: tRNA (adenosine(37)-N6)-threonylcarbamoyltransferase complex ATPase subunit type 1 TsaE [Pirellulaceae bacterium]